MYLHYLPSGPMISKEFERRQLVIEMLPTAKPPEDISLLQLANIHRLFLEPCEPLYCIYKPMELCFFSSLWFCIHFFNAE